MVDRIAALETMTWDELESLDVLDYSDLLRPALADRFYIGIEDREENVLRAIYAKLSHYKPAMLEVIISVQKEMSEWLYDGNESDFAFLCSAIGREPQELLACLR